MSAKQVALFRSGVNHLASCLPLSETTTLVRDFFTEDFRVRAGKRINGLKYGLKFPTVVLSFDKMGIAVLRLRHSDCIRDGAPATLIGTPVHQPVFFSSLLY